MAESANFRRSELQERNLTAFGTQNFYEEKEFLRWQEPKLEVIGELIASLPSHDHVADIGCYTGIGAEVFRRHGVAELDGYDASPYALEMATSRGMRTFLWNCDGEACPSPSAAYDVVVAADIIEHLVNTDYFLQELHRILKPGGFLIVSTPNLASWRSRIRLLRGKPPASFPGASSSVARDFWVDRNHIRVNVYAEWHALLEHHGFHVEKVAGSTYMHLLSDSPRHRLIKWVDRQALRRPTLATGLVMVARARGRRNREP